MCFRLWREVVMGGMVLGKLFYFFFIWGWKKLIFRELCKGKNDGCCKKKN